MKILPNIVGRGRNASGEVSWAIPPYLEETVEVYIEDAVTKLLPAILYGMLDNEPVKDYDGKVSLGSELARQL